ncbi:hypothetical protein BOX17_12940 [Halomonas aestuarii]|uniref:Yip1 domain-containing protein n=1 Tax=Halomonas aestuarii TaxID=1897729 RepID=A0A1J0VID7_9GAMM|nr:YIP1 family protein [Halomonas aestuarii]APE31778.1 hypothetical protein BOX17_12940 [Halomonas aestuarii]
MNAMTFLRLPFSGTTGWKELQKRQFPIPSLAWLVVLPMSLLPPLMLYYAGTHYGNDFATGFAERPWRFITTILFLAELLTFFVMGWLIHAVVNGQEELSIDYHDAYLLAAMAPLPLWMASLVLVIPSLLLNALVVLAALGLSCSLIYHGLQGLCSRDEDDVVALSATYTIMATGVLAWGVLMAVVWAY